MAKMEHAVELLGKLGDVCETAEEAEQMVWGTLCKAEVEILKAAAKKECHWCEKERELYKVTAENGNHLWAHRLINPATTGHCFCKVSNIQDLIVEITESKTEIPT